MQVLVGNQVDRKVLSQLLAHKDFPALTRLIAAYADASMAAGFKAQRDLFQSAKAVLKDVPGAGSTVSAMIRAVPDTADGSVHTYQPINGFTTTDLGVGRGNNATNIIVRLDFPATNEFLNTFDILWRDDTRLQDVTDVVLDNITAAYGENAPDYIYFVAHYNIFNEFLEDISEDVLPNETTGFRQSKIWNMLYHFQRDAVLAIISKLEKFNGCILADSVGLGKTFTALAVIKYYENRNKSVLVLCPKKLSANWNTYKDNYINNPIAADRLRYDVLYHTDLSRAQGQSNGLDLSRLNWGNYDLVVIEPVKFCAVEKHPKK